jgi:hypothetical protein
MPTTLPGKPSEQIDPTAIGAPTNPPRAQAQILTVSKTSGQLEINSVRRLFCSLKLFITSAGDE